jgi:acetoin:2,6-dichlorophenolindophenol oxidoreductase subunit beta
MPEVSERELTYGRAVNEALRRALLEWSETILFGEDVGKPGNVFGITQGLHQEFGHRVFDTPISEAAILGAAVGSAMFGRRPIVEIMWIDFSLVAVDQIVNQAANVRYVSEGRLHAPLTIRTQQGALPGSCAQHSQNLEAFYAHVPGLRVAMPATPQDAYDILLAAIACDDPVLVIENRGLYASQKATVRLGGTVQSIGKARVERTGSHVTLLTWSAMLNKAREAVAQLEAQGISVELIDARWLNPFDWDTLRSSVEKTGRLVIAHEANLTGGFGAEVAARVYSECLYSLEAPVKRVGLPDMRLPSAPHLQAALLPNTQTIVKAILDVLGE